MMLFFAPSPNRFRRLRQARAFSLVEILTVATIIAVGTGIALYSYTTYRKSLVLQTAGSTVQRTLMQARGRAIQLNLPHQAIVDIDNNSVWVNQLNSTKTATTPKVVPETGLGESVQIDSLKVGASTFTSGTHLIDFETDGQNPLVVLNLRRRGASALVTDNIAAVRLYPTSGQAQFIPKQQL